MNEPSPAESALEPDGGARSALDRLLYFTLGHHRACLSPAIPIEDAICQCATVRALSQEAWTQHLAAKAELARLREELADARTVERERCLAICRYYGRRWGPHGEMHDGAVIIANHIADPAFCATAESRAKLGGT